MHDFDPIVSPYNGHMLRNLSKYYLFICCKQSSSTHFCHFLATTFVTDVLMGANPSVMGAKRKVSIAGGLTIQWWAMRDVRGRLAPPAPRFVAPLLACCAGKRLRVSSAPHPCGFESLRLPTRKASRSAMRSRGWFLWLGRRDSNPQQPAPKTGVLPLNYVPMCGVAKSNSSSLPNLRGHRKRHRAGVPRASGRRWQ